MPRTKRNSSAHSTAMRELRDLREVLRVAASEAITACGGAKALADKLNIKYQSVQEWAVRGVPPARVLEVEAATGVSRHKLRPDVFGKRRSRATA